MSRPYNYERDDREEFEFHLAPEFEGTEMRAVHVFGAIHAGVAIPGQRIHPVPLTETSSRTDGITTNFVDIAARGLNKVKNMFHPRVED